MFIRDHRYFVWSLIRFSDEKRPVIFIQIIDCINNFFFLQLLLSLLARMPLRHNIQSLNSSALINTTPELPDSSVVIILARMRKKRICRHLMSRHPYHIINFTKDSSILIRKGQLFPSFRHHQVYTSSFQD